MWQPFKNKKIIIMKRIPMIWPIIFRHQDQKWPDFHLFGHILGKDYYCFLGNLRDLSISSMNGSCKC